jgi:hypothetical protein
MAGFGLDSGVQFLAGAEIFSATTRRLIVGPIQPPYPMHTRVQQPVYKLTTHLHLVLMYGV